MSATPTSPSERIAGVDSAPALPPEDIPERDGLYLWLAALAGNEPSDSFLEIRPLKPSGAQEWIPIRELRHGVDAIMRLRDRHEVFVGVCPRTGRGGKAENVVRCWSLVADCDSPESVERLRRFRPLPSIVVESSPSKRHAYWPLRRPLENDAATGAKQALVRALGSDEAVCDPARVMRTPASVHRKGKPVSVRCLRLKIKVFDAKDVVGSLPARRITEPPKTRPVLSSSDALDAIPASEYIPLLTGCELGRDHKLLCPFHDERTPSLHAYPTPEQGWTCFGCGLGGSIIDFGAHLYGLEPRGRDFHEIRKRLLGDPMGRAA